MKEKDERQERVGMEEGQREVKEGGLNRIR